MRAMCGAVDPGNQAAHPSTPVELHSSDGVPAKPAFEPRKPRNVGNCWNTPRPTCDTMGHESFARPRTPRTYQGRPTFRRVGVVPTYRPSAGATGRGGHRIVKAPCDGPSPAKFRAGMRTDEAGMVSTRRSRHDP